MYTILGVIKIYLDCFQWGNSWPIEAASLTIQACNLQDAYDLHDLTHIN